MEDGFATKVAILNRPKKLNALNENMVMLTFHCSIYPFFIIVMNHFDRFLKGLVRFEVTLVSIWGRDGHW